MQTSRYINCCRYSRDRDGRRRISLGIIAQLTHVVMAETFDLAGRRFN